MKKAHPNRQEPSPVSHRRVVELLDAARTRVDERSPDSYARVLRHVETVAEILRETTVEAHVEATEWSVGDEAHEAHVHARVEHASGTFVVDDSGARASITLEEAQKTIEALREEDAMREYVQIAIGGS